MTNFSKPYAVMKLISFVVKPTIISLHLICKKKKKSHQGNKMKLWQIGSLKVDNINQKPRLPEVLSTCSSELR